MNTVERLNNYYAFNSDLTQSIADVAAHQNKMSFRQLADQYDIAGGPKVAMPLIESTHTVEYLNIKPIGSYEKTRAKVLFTPMGNPVNESMAMRGIRLVEADEDNDQLFIFGAPSIAGNRHNRVTIASLPRVAKGDFSPLAIAPAAFLHGEGIETIDTLGYSYGAEMALALGNLAFQNYGTDVERIVAAEPTSIENKEVISLGMDFLGSGNQLQKYIDQADSRPLDQSHVLANSGLARYVMGLGRLTNLAIASGIAKGNFANRVAGVLNDNTDLGVAIAYGTASELVDANRADLIVSNLHHQFGARISGIKLEGMHHAGGDDIDLHAAIMLQGLRNITR